MSAAARAHDIYALPIRLAVIRAAQTIIRSTRALLTQSVFTSTIAACIRTEDGRD